MRTGHQSAAAGDKAKTAPEVTTEVVAEDSVEDGVGSRVDVRDDNDEREELSA